mmetsp:Transcript_43879/g.110619  ORF Transcript_43879/g.110619 Transcript_43879/m.110619 type:complete len:104 (-) Transcript_43879:195-506(-)
MATGRQLTPLTKAVCQIFGHRYVPPGTPNVRSPFKLLKKPSIRHSLSLYEPQKISPWDSYFHEDRLERRKEHRAFKEAAGFKVRIPNKKNSGETSSASKKRRK